MLLVLIQYVFSKPLVSVYSVVSTRDTKLSNTQTLSLGDNNTTRETSLVAKWLGLCTSTSGGMGSIPGQRAKILHATWHGLKTK